MNTARPDLPSILAAAVFAAIGALAIFYASEFTPLGSVFPRTIAAAMIVLCMVYIAVALVRPRSPEAQPAGSTPRRLLLAITMLAWALLLEPLGFLSTSIICYAAILVTANYDRWTPRRALLYTAVGIAVMGVLYGTFRYALQVPFPTGILL